jgi:hypothetical protein
VGVGSIYVSSVSGRLSEQRSQSLDNVGSLLRRFVGPSVRRRSFSGTKLYDRVSFVKHYDVALSLQPGERGSDRLLTVRRGGCEGGDLEDASLPVERSLGQPRYLSQKALRSIETGIDSE